MTDVAHFRNSFIYFVLLLVKSGAKNSCRNLYALLIAEISTRVALGYFLCSPGIVITGVATVVFVCLSVRR